MKGRNPRMVTPDGEEIVPSKKHQGSYEKESSDQSKTRVVHGSKLRKLHEHESSAPEDADVRCPDCETIHESPTDQADCMRAHAREEADRLQREADRGRDVLPVTDGGVDVAPNKRTVTDGREELWPDNPHTVPRIECGRCETDHHIDAALGEYQGHCRECYGFLRRPTDEEQQEFTAFMAWNVRKQEREDRANARTDVGDVPVIRESNGVVDVTLGPDPDAYQAWERDRGQVTILAKVVLGFILAIFAVVTTAVLYGGGL